MRQFLESYIEAALFSSTDSADMPLDCHYGLMDVSPETFAKMQEDCKKFVDLHWDTISIDVSRAGADFWYTRNRHGTGFWDDARWETTIGKKLTESAHTFGEFNLYVGDDCKIHH